MPLPGDCINTTPSSSATRLAVPTSIRSSKLYKNIELKMRRKSFRRKAVRFSLVGLNVIILVGILSFVLNGSASNNELPKASSLSSLSNASESNPLDQVSSADIALTVARMNDLPETTAISNQSQSQAAEVAISTSSNNVTAKPEVVTTALKSKADIVDYTAVAGDTISSIAVKYGVTSDSIRWSNNLNGDSVAAGTKLSIPPVNGIVYTVKAGDTLDSLAAKFRASKDQIIAYNDNEIKGIAVGEKLLIPNGSVAAAAAPVTTASSIAGGAFPWGNGPLYGYNGYDYGYCTWYVATQISVPANWGNAATWAFYAARSGWNVSGVPTVGAIAQKGGGYGHVAIVDAVSPDGSMIMYKDMNGVAGWGRVGQSGWVSVSRYEHYISR